MSTTTAPGHVIEDQPAIQQLDPLGTLDGRPVTVLAALGILLFSAISTAVDVSNLLHIGLAVAAIVAVLVTAIVLVIASDPLRAPFTPAMHALAVGTAVLACALSSASMIDTVGLATLGWGPIVVGVTCIALAPYRPVSELITVGVVASIFTGFIALVGSGSSTSDAGPMILALSSITPVLTMSLGGAAFAGSLAHSHQRWESRVKYASGRQRERQHQSMARSVQQDRITILNRDVVPLFTEMATRGIVSPEDRENAARYAASLRELMVNEVNRSWLEVAVSNSFGPLDDGHRVVDPHRLAPAMTAHQRTALRAAVLAVVTGRELRPESVRLAIERTATGALVTVHATVASSESSWRSSLAPYFAVLRVVFTGLRVSYRSPTLTIRFTYDTP